MEQGFSDTGLIVFGCGLFGSMILIFAAMVVTWLFGGRNRGLKGCGVGCIGLVLGTGVVIVCGLIATMV